MRALTMILLLLPGAGFAGDFVPMSGHEIRAALTDQSPSYGAARQVFYTSGQTLYEDKRPSWGRWRVTGDQYCSQWPPSELWSCYDMARNGATLRFIAADGSTSDGTYEE
ncbi:MAG TPA: hypothetical protein ENK83_04790 [Aliiroseovarius sp.]|nr:hypothetical protein [Aliiroseovarius sp.]